MLQSSVAVEREDGERYGAGEVGDLRALTLPTEGNERVVEGFAH